MNISKRSVTLVSFLFIVLIFSLVACERSGPAKPDEVTGDYIFVERIISTDAVVLAGDSAKVRPICGEPHIFYDYYPVEKKLEYRLGPEIPVNSDLKVIFGDKHFYLPPYAGCGGGTISLTPIYYLTATWALDGSLKIQEFGVSSGRIGIVYPPRMTEILLDPGEVYNDIHEKTQWVKFSRFEGGTFITDSALVKYIDRITIRNWGFAPRSKIIRKTP